jgi:hypothetical protein
MSVALEKEEVEAIFDAVSPGLLGRVVSKAILKEEHYAALIRDADGEDYSLTLGGWRESTTAHFHFVVLSRLPLPPEWCTERFFILKVAGG